MDPFLLLSTPHTQKNGIIGSSDNEISDESIYILNNVVCEYGKHSASHLSELSHKETSWINSRRGLASQMPGHNALKLTDIQEDAKKVRPYDHIWDMYYDEFEDADDTEVGEV